MHRAQRTSDTEVRRYRHTARAAFCACLLLTPLLGCQSPSRPIFPAVDPPLVWPPPPDTPRVRYIGALYGESSLDAKPRGWDAVRAVLAGPQPPVEFVRPVAVAIADERVYVADPGLGIVHLLDLQRRRHEVLTGAPTDPLRVPIDLLVVPPGVLLVADRGRAAVDVFELDGRWRETRRWPEVTGPVSLAYDAGGGMTWIADADAHACWAVGKSGIAERIGQRGSRPGEFNYPSAAAFDARVGLVVADAMNFRVQVFRDSAGPALVFGRKGDASGDFARPRDVALDAAGHVYVLDNQFENIQVFTPDGQLLMAFGQGGDGPGEFSLPAGLTIDERGRIWVADSFNRRVQVLQYLPEEGP